MDGMLANADDDDASTDTIKTFEEKNAPPEAFDIEISVPFFHHAR